jgi:hypothetical protein
MSGQSLAVADKDLFRNCLVTMRPKTTKNDLPSTHDVSVYIHNRFVDQLKLLKKEISVSTTLIISKVLLTYSGRRRLVKFQLLPMDGQQIIQRGHSLG